MKPEAIFVPVSVLALWTACIVFMVGLSRVRAARAGRVPRGAFRLGESAEVPADVAVWNRNLMNLLEMPLLFYVVSLALYVTRHVTARTVAMAWIYVALRFAHSLVHVTSNKIIARLLLYAASNFVLLALWIGFISRLL
ncbi:MAG TPA: MAPEG family protein [Polyangia bacterium]|nr:MAPEG family protein [Polyangia bacterium]